MPILTVHKSSLLRQLDCIMKKLQMCLREIIEVYNVDGLKTQS